METSCQTNILKLIHNISSQKLFDLSDYKTKSSIRINAIGDLLESYIKDALCGTFFVDETTKLRKIDQTFSYGGNQNNPPDIVIKMGDAIEIKKIESFKTQLALNSSYPKDALYIEDTRLNLECKNVLKREHSPKDLFYIIGFVKESKIQYLQIVQGKCYCAEPNIYENVFNRVKNALETSMKQNSIDYSPTKEIGRINKVDPLGITYFRIRGMWGIDNPINVFDYIDYIKTENKRLQLVALMEKEKFLSFPKEDIDSMNEHNIIVKDVKIKNPNNSVNLKDAILIKFSQ